MSNCLLWWKFSDTNIALSSLIFLYAKLCLSLHYFYGLKSSSIREYVSFFYSPHAIVACAWGICEMLVADATSIKISAWHQGKMIFMYIEMTYSSIFRFRFCCRLRRLSFQKKIFDLCLCRLLFLSFHSCIILYHFNWQNFMALLIYCEAWDGN